MKILRKVSLLALAHEPGYGQRAAFIDHVDHQRDATTTHDAAIDHQHQRLEGQMLQQDIGIR